VTARVIQADVFDALPTLAAGSVDCCVTSIPSVREGCVDALASGHLRPVDAE